MPDFGIAEGITAALEAAGTAEATATAVAPFAAGALEGTAFGAGEAAITGGNIGKGALTGAITGGAVGGLGPILSSATDLGLTASDAIVGATAGGIGAAATSGNVLGGAASGGIGGAIAGSLGGAGGGSGSGVGTSVTPASAGGTGGGSAAAAAGPAAPSPAGVGVGGPAVDLTGQFGLDSQNVPIFDSSGTSGYAGSATGANAVTQGPAASSGLSNLFGGTPGNYSGGEGLQTNSSGGGAAGGGGASKVFGLGPAQLIGGAALGANLVFGNQPTSAEKAIGQEAGEAQSQARTLAAYQQSGTLPAGLQSVVDQQFDAAKGQVVSQYAGLGLGNSTQLADKLNQLKEQKSAEVATFADSLAKQGISVQTLSAQEFGQLLQAETARNTQFTSAISNFARGLAGGGLGANNNNATS